MVATAFHVHRAGPAREVLHLLDARAVSSIHVTKVAGHDRRPARKSPLSWYCVRALVVIRVEYATSGMQNIEDRFVLVRASSAEDTKKRLKHQWHEYARPYLNPNGEMVSWQLDHIADVYQHSRPKLTPRGPRYAQNWHTAECVRSMSGGRDPGKRLSMFFPSEMGAPR
ncbi:MAG: hypothetical protein DMG32_22280 [Acidobacteria bacterium]|nr:MAG: hypothetical protein DMG32_22280 [Acidobacteriota bacterium]